MNTDYNPYTPEEPPEDIFHQISGVGMMANASALADRLTTEELSLLALLFLLTVAKRERMKPVKKTFTGEASAAREVTR